MTTVAGAQRMDRRLVELLARSGRANGRVVFEVLRASRGRGASIQVVRRHQCRHDEGIRDCSTAPTVEG